jgi:hypothetical protein
MQSAYEVAQSEATVADEPLNLVEFCQMGPIDVLIPKHTVNGEVLGRLESILCEAV